MKTNRDSIPVAGVIHLPVVVKLESELVTLKYPDTADGGVIVLAEQTHGGEGVFVEFVQSLEHP